MKQENQSWIVWGQLRQKYIWYLKNEGDVCYKF